MRHPDLGRQGQAGSSWCNQSDRRPRTTASRGRLWLAAASGVALVTGFAISGSASGSVTASTPHLNAAKPPPVRIEKVKATSVFAVGSSASGRCEVGGVTAVTKGKTVTYQGSVARVGGATTITPTWFAGVSNVDAMACASAELCVGVGFAAHQGTKNVTYDGVIVVVHGSAATAVDVPGTSTLRGIACPTASTCYAVGDTDAGEFGPQPGDEGVIVTITNGKITTTHVVAKTTRLLGIACPSARTCDVVGEDLGVTSGGSGVLVDLDRGALHRQPNNDLSPVGIACPTSMTCDVTSQSSGGGAVGPAEVGRIVSGKLVVASVRGISLPYVAGVACVTATLCEAVGDDAPEYRTQTEAISPSGGSPKAPYVGHGAVGASTIACPTPTCVIATGELDVVFWSPRLPKLRVITSALPVGTAKRHYRTRLKSAGGYPPADWKVTDGELPPGLLLSAAGLLRGTPTVSGTFAVTVAATDTRDRAFTAKRAYKIKITR
jgi:hypothetical protein